MRESLDTTIREYFGLDETKSDLGIEIELESEHWEFNHNTALSGWDTHEEGSIRNGVEFVTRLPMKINQIATRLENLREYLGKSKIDYSGRTSNHIHVNCQELNISQIFSVLTIYWTIENILVHMNGKIREGNPFCLRMADAEGLFRVLCTDLSAGVFLSAAARNDFRYAACNLASLRKFGTLEFRFMKSSIDTEEVSMWVNALLRMIEFASSMTVKETLDFVSREDPMIVLSKLFSADFVRKITETCSRQYIEDSFALNNDLLFMLAKMVDLADRRGLHEFQEEDLEEDLEAAKRKKTQQRLNNIQDPRWDVPQPPPRRVRVNPIRARDVEARFQANAFAQGMPRFNEIDPVPDDGDL